MNSNDLNVSFAPLLSHQVEYFDEIHLPVTIVNRRPEPMIIEGLQLQIKGEGDVDFYLNQEYCAVIEPHGLVGPTVELQPDLRFRPHTNMVKVMVRYREVLNGVPGSLRYVKSEATYLIMNPCTEDLGQLFISFKQPEDGHLAKLLSDLATRAGFTTYMKLNDPAPGKDIWETIEPQLFASVAAAFIWTDRTPWGNGVEREAMLCKENGKYSIPLIATGQNVPDFFRDTGIEYSFFDRDAPLETFAGVVGSLRARLAKGPFHERSPDDRSHVS